jgi:glucuronoarabinoxylan endo-1,4-beta-xylanase
MLPSRFCCTALTAFALAGSGCSSDTGVHANGGQPGAGHTSEQGGTNGGGGVVSSGGVTVTGGLSSTSSASAGRVSTGGTIPTGGLASSGGQADTGGTRGTGGRTGTGGTSATGGTIGTGGASGGRTGTGGAAGGTTGTGGVIGTGGSVGTGGAVITGGKFTPTKTPGTAQTGDITINPEKTYQVMDGFGIADVWQAKSTSSAAQRTLFWDPDQGIGMSILRAGIDENGKIMGDAAFVEAPDVVKYGGKVWAAPWSPPASYKDNSNINNGGHLNTSSYEAWATTLAAFPAYFKQNAGVDLWGLSAQNEPDFVASYRSCIFSAAQMNAFLKVLGPKLHALSPPVKVIAAEPDVWSHLWNNGDKYGSAIEGDATVSSLVDVHATHDYGSNVQSTTRPSPPAGTKHPVWQTEATYTAGAGIGPALDFARCIYAGVTTGGTSGWVYWWTTSFMDGGSTASPPKRVYAMGNYSKFVRPGYVRVDATGVPSSVQIVPFQNPADGTLAIVAQNSGSSAVAVSFFVSGAGWPGTVTPYVTSASSNLAAGTAVTVTAGRFSGSLAAQSVTTFVGKQ